MTVADSSPRAIAPVLFVVQMIPFGAAVGFLTVTLSYFLPHRGIDASGLSWLIALCLVPHTWRFLWAPAIDVAWTRKRWYQTGTVLCAAGLWLAGLEAQQPHPSLPLLAACLLVCHVGATLLSMAVDSLAAAVVPDALRGRTAGWIQAGNVGGLGVGGGVSLWLIQYEGFGCGAAAGLLAGVFMLCCLALLRLPNPALLVAPDAQHEVASARLSLSSNARAVVSDLWRMSRSRPGVLVMLLSILPIAGGAASNLWDGFADTWNVDAATVAVVDGWLGGLISAAGCLAAGWLCDRFDRKTLVCVFGLITAASSVGMALSPHTRDYFVFWDCVGSFSAGLSATAIGAAVFELIGRTAAATKYSLLSALGNMALQYMTLIDGAVAASHGPDQMLLVDAACSVAGLVIFIVVSFATKRHLVGHLGILEK